MQIWLTLVRSETVEGSGNTIGVVRHTSEPKTHFHAAECSRQHQIIEAT
jgi:hypothetical protein